MWRLFVYGTLRRGCPNHALLKGRTLSEEPAYADHLALYSNASGTFPYATLTPGRRITGMLCTIAEEKWPGLCTQLDFLEGYRPYRRDDNHYLRVLWPVRTTTGVGASAWIYLASNTVRLDPDRLIRSGDWLNR